MKGHLHFSLLLLVVVMIAALLSGCALSHTARGLSLTTDRQVYDTLTDPINITLSSNLIVPDQYQLVQYQITDNGREIAGGTIPRSTNSISPVDPLPHTYGPHSIAARGRFYNSESDHGDWWPAGPVCIFVGGDLPDTYSCLTYGFPEPLTAVTATPEILTILPTDTPTITPIPANTTNRKKGGQQGGGTGCGAYTTQSSCNLAGCSWSAGSCTVNP